MLLRHEVLWPSLLHVLSLPIFRLQCSEAYYFFLLFLSLWLTMVVLRSLSLSPPRPDTTLSSRTGGLAPTRNFPDKLRYRRRAALGEERLADLRVEDGWWAWSPLMGCAILAESALEERWVGEKHEGCVTERRGIWSDTMWQWGEKRSYMSSICIIKIDLVMLFICQQILDFSSSGNSLELHLIYEYKEQTTR